MKNKIGLGTWQFGKHFWGDVRDDESLEIIKVALEHGVNLIDTAPVYGDGHSEEIVGKGIQGNRENVFLATKCGLIHNQKGFFHNLTPESLENELYSSLKRLKVEYIDLYQIHWPDPNYSTDKAIETLLKFKEKKLIKQVGVCNLTLQEIEKTELLSELYSLQTQYSLLNFLEQAPLLQFCINKKLLTITYGAFHGGLLLNKFDSPKDIPHKSAKNFFYQGKSVWEQLQKTIKEQETLAMRNNLSLSQQVLQSTIEKSTANYTLIGCRTLKQLKENISFL